MDRYEKKISYLLYILTIITLLTMFFTSFSEYIWLDEAFSLKLIQHSYKDVILLTAQDVHPPLYYIVLKFFVDIGNKLGGTDKVVGSMVSMIPYISLLVIAFTKIRKRWGILTSSIFIFCVTLMPNCSFPGTEIRMYSFGMLFVTLAYIEAYDIIIKRSWKYWIRFLIFGVCAAYTHYFACIAVAFIYIYLLLWSIIKERTEFKKWLLMSGGTVILYLPWLFVVLKQVSDVKSSYWIPPITLANMYGYIKFVLSPNKGILMALLGISYVYLFSKLFFGKKNQEIKLYTITGFLVLCFTVLFGIVVSFLMRPIFVDRYIIPSLGCFWLCFAICLGCLDKSKMNRIIQGGIIFVLLVVGYLNYKSFTTQELTEMKDINRVKDILVEENAEENVIITDNIHVQFPLSNYLDKDVYIYGEEIGDLTKDVYGNIGVIDLEDMVLNGKTALYFNTGDMEEMARNLKNINPNVTIDYIEDINFASMDVSLYKIKEVK